MGQPEKPERFYLSLLSELYRDIAECYSLSLRMQAVELRLVEARFAQEGLSFLTKTLPGYRKALDSALSSGSLFKVIGFKTSKDSVIPKFLGWLLNRVFDASGKELDQPDPIAVAHFRQLTDLFYKLEIPHDKKTEDTVIKSFIETDAGLEPYNSGPLLDILSGGVIDGDQPGGWNDEWIQGARSIVHRVIAPLDPYRIKPRHGPGNVATGENVISKTRFSRIYSTLERVYPFTEWMRFNLNHVAMSIPARDTWIKLVDEPTAKVVLVPKDSRGPRLISCEPLEIQWIQQGLARLLVDRIESCKWSKGYVNFTDQSINQRLSLSGSNGSGWVTLDMKEASDRVSVELVKALFADNASLLEALLAARSTQTKLPNGTVIRLEKFAPMGSATCFPVEALCFWALAVSAIKRSRTIRWRDARESVYVYGDDIIVNEQDYTTLLQHLPRVGLMFNKNKCCTGRFFRESCGCDAYVGVDVTPTRIKTVWSRHRSNDPKILAAYTAFSNAMYGRGFFRTAEYVRRSITNMYGKLPYTNRFSISRKGEYETEFDMTYKLDHVSTAGGPAFVCHEPSIPKNQALGYRYTHNELFYPCVYSWAAVPNKVQTPWDGYPEWLRRQSDGFGSYGGSYALARSNRLKRACVVV